MTAAGVGAGIVSYAAYVPSYVLPQADFAGEPRVGGDISGRSVASFDQDPVTLAVEAGRALDIDPSRPLLFATAQPPYVDKSCAATVHAALDLDSACAVLDLAGLRAGAGALGVALRGGGAALVADVRTTNAGAPDELRCGDAAAAFVCEADRAAARLLASASATEEVLDRWRLPGAPHATVWDERFTVGVYTDLMVAVARQALGEAGVAEPDHVVVSCANARAAAAVRRTLSGSGADAALERSTGHTGAAHLGLLLADALDRCRPGDTVLAIGAADGADAYVFAVTDAITGANPGVPVRAQVAARMPVSYERFLRWRGLLSAHTPRRPEPEAPASAPSSRGRRWKFGLVAAVCDQCGTVAAPPVPRCPQCRVPGPTTARPIRERACTVVSSVPDHLAYSLDPPVVRAVVDIEGGGRRAVEVTDVPPGGVAVGDRMRPTFRRLYTSGGVHNYFWKTTPGGNP